MSRRDTLSEQTNDKPAAPAAAIPEAQAAGDDNQGATGAQDGSAENRDGDGIDNATGGANAPLTDDDRQAAGLDPADDHEDEAAPRVGLALFEMRPISELAMNYRKLADEGRLDSRTSELFGGVIQSLEAISEQLDEIRAASSPR